MKKENVDMLVASLLIIVGCVLMILPHTSNDNVRNILTCVMALYVILNFGKYFLTSKSKDYEGLQVAIASIASGVLAFLLEVNDKPKYLALTVLIWIALMALIKLKKVDYYHDRQNILWIFKLFTFGFFLLTGILTSINLYYNSEIQILILGYFFLIHGILELFEPLTTKLLDKVKK